MAAKDTNLLVGAVSGAVYRIAFNWIGILTGLASGYGVLILAPLNAIGSVIGYPLAKASVKLGLLAIPILPSIIALLPNILIGGVIGWLMPVMPPKKLFVYCLVIQLFMNLIVGIPLVIFLSSKVQ